MRSRFSVLMNCFMKKRWRQVWSAKDERTSQAKKHSFTHSVPPRVTVGGDEHLCSFPTAKTSGMTENSIVVTPSLCVVKLHHRIIFSVLAGGFFVLERRPAYLWLPQQELTLVELPVRVLVGCHPTPQNSSIIINLHSSKLTWCMV